MPLTNAELEKIKKSGEPGKYFDGGGLYVELTKSRAMYWRLKYRFAGKENRLSLGVYPAVGGKAARDAREAAKKLLASGTDPSQARKIEKIAQQVAATNTFKAVALEWHGTKSSGWSPSHAATTIERLNRDLFPWLGSRPLTELTPPEMLVTLRRIQDRGSVETARRCRGYISQIFKYAISVGIAYSNPAESLGAGLKTAIGGHHPAIVEPVRFGAMLRATDHYVGSYVTRAAMQIHALTCQRPGEVSAMAWAEIDLEAAWWVIPAARMKGTLKRKARENDHYVPLSTQAIAVLKDLQPLTGHGPLVFPGERHGRCISENTARMGIRSMGFADHTPHGFRASIRTMAREQLRYHKEVIERLLAHGSDEALGGAYDRTQYFSDRIRLVQDWADYMDKLRVGADVIPINFGKAA